MQLEERLYTSTEVAEILGVSLRSVYRYLEEDKIQADVKTATGRHRFSKQNILDFLYPKTTQAPSQVKNSQVNFAPVKESRNFVSNHSDTVNNQQQFTHQEYVAPQPTPVETYEPVQEVPVQAASQQQPREEEPVDWLAKFKAAAEKYKAEQAAKVTPAVEKSTDDLYDMSTFKSQKEESAPEVSREHYYKSFVGGLKDIAQALDKSSKRNSLDYAFTMNAGLSLHKPIKPFSILHAYVRSKDLDFFEKTLQLSPTTKENSQLCLIVSDEESIYSTIREMHGLNVVANNTLRKDLLNAGDHDLVKELDNI